MTRMLPIVFSAIVLTFSAALDAQRTWVEVRSPNFAVMSEGDERGARGVAWQFEQVRVALNRVWDWAGTPPDRPTHVFAVRGEDGMKALAPRYWEARGGMRPTSVYVTAPTAITCSCALTSLPTIGSGAPIRTGVRTGRTRPS